MASPNRINLINNEITRVLADKLKTVKDPRVSGLCSVVRVDTSGDLSVAKVYVSSLGGGKDVIKGLRSASGYLRRELSIALNLRHTPALEFILDSSIEEGAHMLGLLSSLREDEGE